MLTRKLLATTGVMMMLAGLCTRGPGGVTLIEAMMPRAQAWDDTSDDEPSHVGCEWNTKGTGQVTSVGCYGKPAGTPCVKCSSINPGLFKVPDTSGGAGIEKAGPLIPCDNAPKYLGKCFNNECTNYPPTPTGKCTGTVEKYLRQTDPDPP